MAGLFVALVAIWLGGFGPRFRWKGAAWLAATMIVVGLLATLQAAAAARAAGLLFRVTPLSLLAGLAEQVLFVSVFYALAALAHWSHAGLTRGGELPAE